MLTWSPEAGRKVPSDQTDQKPLARRASQIFTFCDDLSKKYLLFDDQRKKSEHVICNVKSSCENEVDVQWVLLNQVNVQLTTLLFTFTPANPKQR